MGNRLSKIVTKTGDNGTTGLGDGSRVQKSSFRICAIGDVDELNCVIGLVISNLDSMVWGVGKVPPHQEGNDELKNIQHLLFDVGGELSMPNMDYSSIDVSDIEHIESDIERFNKDLPYLKNFILPSGNELVSRLHHARAVARRAERSVVRLSRVEFVNTDILKFLNRLSDFLFVLARVHADGVETLWVPKRDRGDGSV